MLTRLPRLVAICVLLFVAAVALAAEPDRFGDALPPHAVARIGTTRLRHGGAIISIVFAADGKTFATTSLDRTVSVWETETGRERVRCRGFGREPLTTVFAEDGKTLTCTAADGTVHVFSLEMPKDQPLPAEAKEPDHFPLQISSTGATAFSNDARRLAVGDDDGKLQLWDLKQRKSILAFHHDDHGVRCVALSPDAKTLASTSSINGIQLWDATTGQKRAALGRGAYSVLRFSPDGSELAAGNFDNAVQIFDATKGTILSSFRAHEEIMPISKNGVACLAYAAKSAWLATGGGDGKVSVWERRERLTRQIHRFESHTDRVTAVAFSPDDQWLVSAAADNTIRIYDTKTWKELPPLSPEAPLVGMALSADGKLVATIDTPTNRLDCWDARTGRALEPLPELAGKAKVAAFAPDGKTLAVDRSYQDLAFWNLQTGKRREDWRIKPAKEANGFLHAAPGLVFDASGKRLAFASTDGLFLEVWEPATGQRVALFAANGGRRAHTLSLSPDGALLASAGPEAMVRLWDVENDREKGTLTGHAGGTLAVAFSPNGRLIASGGKDRMIRLWEVAGGRQRLEFGGQPGWVRAVAFAPDGTVLATANTDGVVRLWDLATGRLLHELLGHRGPVIRLAFSAKGDVLASAGADTTVLIWDTAALLKDRKPALLTLTPKELDKAWEQLASTETGVASAALQTLARAPRQTVPLLQQLVKPLSSERLAKLVKDLDDDQFDVREAAGKELAAIGTFAEPALQTTLKDNPSVEVRRRITELLEKLPERGPSPEELRLLRSLEVLELIGDNEAKNVLARVAAGAKESELTRQAKAALERLAKANQRD